MDQQLLRLGFEKELKSGPDAFALGRGDEEIDGILPDRLLARPAEQLLGLRVPGQDRAGLVGLREGIERGVDDVARKLLAFAQGLLRESGLGHVTPDEEEAPGLIGPAAEPGEPDLAPVLVEAAGVGELQTLAAPQRAHLLAGLIEVGGVNEIDAAAADHFPRLVAQNGRAARADLHDMAPRVHDHDQVLRGIEKPRRSSICCWSARSDARASVGCPPPAADADDVARRPPDRREARARCRPASPSLRRRTVSNRSIGSPRAIRTR